MANNQRPNQQPDQQDVLASLGAAADAARQAYLAALAANPAADLSGLYDSEMKAYALWSDAQAKALGNDPAIATATAKLDAATQVIRNELGTIKNVSTWLSLLDNLVQLAGTVAGFFA